jgi:hypothetical protein
VPQIGGVYVPDDLMPGPAPTAPAARPTLGAILASQAAGTWKGLTAALPYQFDVLTRNQVSPADTAAYKAKLEEAQAASARAAPASASDVLSGNVNPLRFAVENLVGSLPALAGITAGTVAGGLAGGPAGALAGGTAAGVPLFSASNVQRAVQEHGALSPEAAERSLALAPLQSAANVAIEPFLPGAGGLLGNTVENAVTSTAGGFLRRTATSMAKAGVVMSAAGVTQQLGERIAAGVPVDGPGAAAEYVNAAVGGFAVGGLLGAGGGFRRTPAAAKPAAEVTVEDLDNHINGVLSGTDRVGSQLALPAPADFHVDSAGQASVNPSGTVQLALPSPDAFPRTDFNVDSTGRAAPADEVPPAVLANIPRSPEPPFELGQTQELGGQLALPPPSTLVDAHGRAVNASDQLPSVGGEPQPATSTPAILSNLPARHFADETLADLQKARDAKGADPVLVEQVDHELASRQAELTGDVPATPAVFQQRLEDAKSGLRGGFVQSLTADTPQELLQKVYTQVFDNADTRSNTVKLAQRLGILDDKMEPGPEAKKLEAQQSAEEQARGVVGAPANAGGDADTAPPGVPIPENTGGSGSTSETAPIAPAIPVSDVAPAAAPEAAPAAPVEAVPTPPAPIESAAPAQASDPEFAVKWAQLKQAAGIERSTTPELDTVPANTQDAAAKVFRLLATDNSDAAVSPVEKLARTMGLITDDNAMDVTPAGRRAFLTTPEGLEETVAAAQQLGHTGKEASLFDRGVKAAVSGEGGETAFSDFKDMAAHEAGKTWAEEFINHGSGERTAAQTKAIQDRVAARGTAVRAASLNRLIDQADLSRVRDSDVAALRRMVRDGASADEVGAALQQVQGGKTLFRQPERQAPALSPLPTRGQPVFKEMAGAHDVETGRSANRAESEAAVQAYRLRSLIDFAHSENAITDARAAKLHDLLDEGKVERVASLLKPFDPDAVSAARKARLPTPPEQEVGRFTDHDAALEQAIAGKSWSDIVQHAVAAAPSKFYREVMKAVGALSAKLEKAGYHFEVRVVKPGDQVPLALNDRRMAAITRTEFQPSPSSVVYLKGAETGAGRVNFQVLAHEMVHAVTSQLLRYGNEKGLADTHIGKAVSDLYALGNALVDHFNGRAKAGNLTPFERDILRGQNTLSNPQEVLAWGLTNPDMQRYLAGIEYKPRQSVFGKLVDLVRGLLGLAPKDDTALTELLRVSEQVFKTPASEVGAMLARNDPNGFIETPLRASETNPSAVNRTVQSANDVTKQVADTVEKAVRDFPIRNVLARAQRTVLGWVSHNAIDREFGRDMPEVVEHSNAHREREAVNGRLRQMGVEGYHAYEALNRDDPKMAGRVVELMQLTTTHQVDPSKPWADHVQHQPKERTVKGQKIIDPASAAESARVKVIYDRAVKLANDLQRGKDAPGMKVFNDLRALNEGQNLMHLAATLHAMVAGDRELSLGINEAETNPMDRFMRQENVTGPAAVRDWWRTQLDQQVADATAFVAAKKGEAEKGTPADVRAMEAHLSPIEARIDAIHTALARMREAPYFHLGRFGDHFVSGVIRKTEAGVADPKAVQHVADQLAKLGVAAQISTDNTRPRIMVRLDTVDARERLKVLMQDMQKQGWLDKEDIKAGPRTQANNFGVQDSMPDYVLSYVESIKASPMFAIDKATMSKDQIAEINAHKAATVQLALDTWLEHQPDNSIARMLAPRETIQGNHPDMIRNFAQRYQVGASHLANVSSAPKFDRAFTGMEARIQDALVAKNNVKPDTLVNLRNELKLRDARNPVRQDADSFDKLRALAHSYYLGLSPAYVLVNLSQVGVTGLPELAKKNGYAASFHALRRASAPAFAILKAAQSEASALGAKHMADLAITESTLKKAGLSPAQVSFMTHMLATGSVDIGSAARAFGRVAEGRSDSKLNTALNYMSATALYSETFSRLLVALASHDLHGGVAEDAAKYASNVVSNSMFDYQSWNTARQLGRQGFAGPITPLFTQFMQYSVQVTEKLYSEMLSSFAKQRIGESAESAAQRRVESRRFMLGHLTAVTALAGTLGLPLASVLATVVERLVGAANPSDEPYDATASWRNFLSDVLGKDVGEVVARGAPRALGFDVSGRVGEQDLLPFSKFLGDRRSWTESLSGLLSHSVGAAPNMLVNVADGGAQFAHGDILAGMKAMLPTAFKGPTEAYRMATDGYYDTRGNKLPMTPGARDILWQLLGLTPAPKAEYNEARGEQGVRRAELSTTARGLTSGIVHALVTGDHDKAKDLVTQAAEFDKANPAFAVIPGLDGALQNQVQAQAQARALNTPVGVSIKDIAGQRLTRYANVY